MTDNLELQCQDPDWAANRIKELERELAVLKIESTSFIATVETIRWNKRDRILDLDIDDDPIYPQREEWILYLKKRVGEFKKAVGSCNVLAAYDAEVIENLISKFYGKDKEFLEFAESYAQQLKEQGK